LLRSPGYMTRALNAIRSVVAHDLLFSMATASSSRKLKEYREGNSKLLLALGVDPASAMASHLLSLLNTPWQKGQLAHVCMGHACVCGGFLTSSARYECVLQISKMLQQVIFGSLPPVPIMARWTKVAATTAWFALGCIIHRFLPKVARFEFLYCLVFVVSGVVLVRKPCPKPN
jgi:hypothetical protein